MSNDERASAGEQRADFVREAERPAPSLAGEVVGLMAHSGKWWLVPVILALVVIGALVLVGETAIAPFIYTLF